MSESGQDLGSPGKNIGIRDRKGVGFRVVVMDRGLGPGYLGSAAQLSQWPHKLCLSHGKGRKAYCKYMAVPLIPLNNSQIFWISVSRWDNKWISGIY